MGYLFKLACFEDLLQRPMKKIKIQKESKKTPSLT